MVQQIIIEVAGFMNADFGGKIFIGVDDKSLNILGLKDDYLAVDKNKPNRDGYGLFLSNSIFSKLGNDLAAYLNIDFQTIDGKDVCCISVMPSPRFVYYNDDFYLRGNFQTNKLKAFEVIKL